MTRRSLAGIADGGYYRLFFQSNGIAYFFDNGVQGTCTPGEYQGLTIEYMGEDAATKTAFWLEIDGGGSLPADGVFTTLITLGTGPGGINQEWDSSSATTSNPTGNVKRWIWSGSFSGAEGVYLVSIIA